MDRILIGESIRNHREAMRLTVSELSAATSLRPGYLAAIEAGEVEGVPTRTLQKIADAVGANLDAILTGSAVSTEIREDVRASVRITALTLLFSIAAFGVLLVALVFGLVVSLLNAMIHCFGM